MAGLEDRMKAYEAASRAVCLPRTPMIVRVDGRAFHSWCRGMSKPFDENLGSLMVIAAKAVAEDMQGFKLGYVQSDEASFLLTDYDRHESEPWLGGVVQKIASLAASAMTAAFNCAVGEMCPLSPSVAMFDGRVFNVPEADVANYFLWRARDWARNSLSMFARSHFSHKQLHGKSRTAIHEMLHSVGANWATDVSPRMRNGAWFHRDGETSDIWCDYSEVSGLVESVLSPSHSSNA